MPSFLKTAFAIVVLCGLTSVASADIKIKTQVKTGGHGSESAVYIKGKRQRTEMGGGAGFVNLIQCDLKRNVQLNTLTKTYLVTPFGGGAGTAAQTAGPATPAGGGERRRGGIVTTTITQTDTGERRQMFGYTARRIKTSMVSEASADACNQARSKVESDGWYIDLPVAFDCYEAGTGAMAAASQRPDCRDEYRTKVNGTAKLGYPVQVTITTYGNDGQPYTFTQEVTELATATLDDALFEVPADYRQAQSAQEMFSAAATAGARGGDATAMSNSGGMKQPETGNANPTTGAAPAVGPKKPGMVRVGVALARATAGDNLDAAALAEATRNTMINYLTGPAIEVVALDARLPAQIELEAQQKECDHVVYSTITHKKGGGGGLGGFLKKSAPVIGAVPMGRGTGGAVAGAAARTAVYTAAELASAVKAKDEVTFEYSLQPAGGAQGAARTSKAKAKTDGEDIITPLLEQAATAILAEVTKK